jgi:hypothetical protein
LAKGFAALVGGGAAHPQGCVDRTGAVLLTSLSCAGWAWSQKPDAQAPVSDQQAATLQNPTPAADAAPAKFECSDGTEAVRKKSNQQADYSNDLAYAPKSHPPKLQSFAELSLGIQANVFWQKIPISH